MDADAQQRGALLLLQNLPTGYSIASLSLDKFVSALRSVSVLIFR